MHFVYLIQSKKDNSLYIGYTNNLKTRLAQHNKMLNTSTKNKAPYELIYSEIYKSRSDAKYREANLKKICSSLFSAKAQNQK